MSSPIACPASPAILGTAGPAASSTTSATQRFRAAVSAPTARPAHDHHACHPLVTDERAAQAGEFFKQQADQARQIDPAFTGIVDGARLRNGAGIEARRHGRDAGKTTNIGRSAGAATYCHGPNVRATLSHSKD